MTEYLYSNQWVQGRERLQGLEAVEDEATIQHLKKFHIEPNWCCLEVGGGGGSIVKWLCQQIGENGRVVATDIDIRFLEELAYSHLIVRLHDITQDDLETNTFDLIHVRHVLMHVKDRKKVIKKMVDALKPGGWILIEETDFLTNKADTSVSREFRTLYSKITKDIYTIYKRKGMDLHYGMKVFGELCSMGLELVGADGRMRIVAGKSQEALFHKRTYTQLKEKVIGLGQISSQQYEKFLALFEEPTFAYQSRLTISTWGRRPLK